MKSLTLILAIILSSSAFSRTEDRRERRPVDRRGEGRRHDRRDRRDQGDSTDVFASLLLSNTLVNFLEISTITNDSGTNQKLVLMKLSNDSGEFFQSGEMSLLLASAVDKIQEENADISDSEAVEIISDFAQTRL